MNEAIFSALCSCLGLPPSSEQALSLIRQTYTEPENNPQPARTADVIYWSLSPESAEDPEPGLREAGKGKGKVRHDIRNLNGRDSPPGSKVTHAHRGGCARSRTARASACFG